MDIIKSLIVGVLIGVIFKLLRLPVPVPHAFAGVVGIVGIFIGAKIIELFF